MGYQGLLGAQAVSEIALRASELLRDKGHLGTIAQGEVRQDGLGLPGKQTETQSRGGISLQSTRPC